MNFQLNPDQTKACNFLKNWWTSSSRFAVLEGPAGTGKTTIVKHIVKEFVNCVPIFTTPTNEACKQLSNALGSDEVYTIYSLLGFNFDTQNETKVLRKSKDSSLLGDSNLLIIDEASMIGDTPIAYIGIDEQISLLQAIKDTDIRVLFIGHKSQLPEVRKNQSIFDECQSVIFNQEYPTYSLTTPERAKGKLLDFINELETLIYKQPRIIKNDFNIRMSVVNDFIHTKEAKEQFLNDQCKVIAWSNAVVDKHNDYIRRIIFKQDKLPRFVRNDKLLLTNPVSYIGKLDKVSEATMLKAMGKKDNITTFATNTKLTVKSVSQAMVLGVLCWELSCKTDKIDVEFYVPCSSNELSKLAYTLIDKARSLKSFNAKTNAFAKFHFLMSLFANVKYSYAITTHRSQGMTIDKVFVDYDNINQCQNVIMKHKLLYVAMSRAKNEGYLMRG